MPKTIQELAASKAGETAETNGFGSQERPLRPAGLYRLKDKQGNVVDEQIVKSHSKFGDSQAAAFERVGYEYVRPAQPGEVKDIEVLPTNVVEAGGDRTSEDVKGLQARANEQDRVIKELQDQLAGKNAEETKGKSDNAVASESKEAAKEAAIENVAERTGTPLDNDAVPTAPEVPEESDSEAPAEEAPAKEDAKSKKKGK